MPFWCIGCCFFIEKSLLSGCNGQKTISFRFVCDFIITDLHLYLRRQILLILVTMFNMNEVTSLERLLMVSVWNVYLVILVRVATKRININVWGERWWRFQFNILGLIDVMKIRNLFKDFVSLVVEYIFPFFRLLKYGFSLFFYRRVQSSHTLRFLSLQIIVFRFEKWSFCGVCHIEYLLPPWFRPFLRSWLPIFWNLVKGSVSDDVSRLLRECFDEINDAVSARRNVRCDVVEFDYRSSFWGSLVNRNLRNHSNFN